MTRIFLALLSLLATQTHNAVADGDGSMANWRSDVKIRPVLDANAPFHSIHTYYTTCPESPDGSRILFFRSTMADARVGEVCVLDRQSGEVRVLARCVETEDAHRAACQQWILGGQAVVFHEFRDGAWQVVTADLATGETKVQAPGRQAGFCQPNAEVVPIYGSHGDPGMYPNFELLDVRTGKITEVVRARDMPAVWANSGAGGDYLEAQFGGKPTSICFPMMSPDGKRAFFKLATPGLSRDFRSHAFSKRKGVFFYDLTTRDFLYFHPKWGHPAWQPGSSSIINMWSNGPVLLDLEEPRVVKQVPMPSFMVSGGHPSMAPDGGLFVTDGRISGKKGWWGVALGDFDSGEWHLLTQFDNSKGATTWRKNHPHPVFSADGRRLYFNVNSDARTRLFVAEPEN